METNAESVVEIWNPRIKTWRAEDVDHSMDIKMRKELFVRFLGVTNCIGFEEFIGEVPMEHIRSKGKRRLEIDDQEQLMISERRPAPPSSDLYLSALALHSASTSLPSSLTSSPFASFPPSPIFSELDLALMGAGSDSEMADIGSHSPGFSQPTPNTAPLEGTIPNYDQLWAHGYVHVPDARSWPVGMYARDMAWGLTKVCESRKGTEGRFSSVFPDVKWTKATFYRQRDAFFGSTVNEMDNCRLLGRSEGGLWTDWRTTSSGWAKVAEGRKGKASGGL